MGRFYQPSEPSWIPPAQLATFMHLLAEEVDSDLRLVTTRSRWRRWALRSVFAFAVVLVLGVAGVFIVAEEPLDFGALRERLFRRDDDLRAARGERLRDAQADALTATGDERRLTVQEHEANSQTRREPSEQVT